MAEPLWPEALDAIVRRVHLAGDDAWWDSAAAAVAAGLPPDLVAQLATLGLAELLSWTIRLDHDPGLPCAGHQAARRRWPMLVPPASGPASLAAVGPALVERSGRALLDDA